MRIAHSQHLGRIRHLADQIEHRRTANRARGAQRLASHRAQVILKLAGNRAFDGPVTGIVHARRHFIRQKSPLMLEKLDRQHAHVLQRFRDAPGRILRHPLDGRLKPRRRRQRKTQDSFPVVVLDQRVNGGFTGPPTHRENA